MFNRMVVAGCLALGTGMAWSDGSEQRDAGTSVGYSAATVSGDSVVRRGISFDGVIFPVGTDVADDINLTQVDGELFYQAGEGAASLDVGVALRFMDGVLQMNVADYGRYAAFEGLVPLLFSQMRIELPWQRFYVAAQAKGMHHGSDRIEDGNLLLGWQSPRGIGVQAGYRHYRLKLNDYDELERLDIDLSGPYASLSIAF